VTRYELRRADLAAHAELVAGRELLVCQTLPWLEFLRESQSAEPVVAEVLRDGQRVGMFNGAIVRKAGLRILGSPLRGWTTGYMGFTVDRDVSVNDLLPSLRTFAFQQLGCLHVELLDRSLNAGDVPTAWQQRPLHGYEIDLSQSVETLFNAMNSACRRCIRKAEKSGLTVEEVTDPAGFAADYYAQLLEVFAKQSLMPSYSQQRVAQLIRHLHPAGMLLLLRARDADGRVIATSIFPGHGSLMYFWGGASTREGLLNRPNEAMLWHAMRCWRARGVTRFDMGGGGDYKEKYGGAAIEVPWLRSSRSGAVALLRSGAEQALRLKQRLRGSLRKAQD
jgi:CelD/BcsL family acetyltransferase involved in cellulose biosynthesis